METVRLFIIKNNKLMSINPIAGNVPDVAIANYLFDYQ